MTSASSGMDCNAVTPAAVIAHENSGSMYVVGLFVVKKSSVHLVHITAGLSATGHIYGYPDLF